MKLESSSHAQFKLQYHVVWCTKYRNRVLENAVEVELKRILSEACGVYGWTLVEVGIMPDHVHLLVSASPKTSPEEIAKTLKSLSAVALFSAFPRLKKQKFWGSGLWSPATFYGSVGEVNEATVKNYVATQKERE